MRVPYKLVSHSVYLGSKTRRDISRAFKLVSEIPIKQDEIDGGARSSKDKCKYLRREGRDVKPDFVLKPVWANWG